MKTYTQLADEAIAALKAFNDVHRAWNESAKKGGYASNFKDYPRIADWRYLELLKEVAYFDGEAQESLDIMLQEMGIDEEGNPLDDVHGYPMHSRQSLEADRAFSEVGL